MATALCSAALRRPLTPIEQIAATAAAGTEMALTLEGFAQQISQPSSLLSPGPISDRDVRDLAAALAVLARSSLGAMLFGESTVDIDATAQYLSVDLAGHDDQTMSVLMVAVTGWITGLWAGADRTRPKVVLLDEFWRLLGDRATAEWAKYAFKMSRDHGTSYVAVLQHLGDLRSVDTDTRAIALGLLADAETRVVYRQPPDQAAALGELLGLLDRRDRHRATAHPRPRAVEGRRPQLRRRPPPHRHRTTTDRHQPSNGRPAMNPTPPTTVGPIEKLARRRPDRRLEPGRCGVGERRGDRIDPGSVAPGRLRRCRRHRSQLADHR